MSDHTPQPSDELLARYLANEASAGERASVDAWAKSDGAYREALDRLRQAWARKPAGSAWNVDRAWSNVAKRMDAGATVTPIASRARRSYAPLLRAAAVLVAAAGIAMIWKPWRAATLFTAQSFVTATGERRNIDLPDGTRITLGPASDLRVAAGYGEKERRVELTGEAWFEVKHDEKVPFEVLAAATISRDIGTSFSIRALRGDSIVRVAVTEGFVSLRHADLGVADGVTLRPNDVGVMSATARVPRVDTTQSAAALTAWRTGRLEFDNTPAGDVATEISRWYGVSVRFADPTVRARRITGGASASDLAELQAMLTLVLGARIDRVGDTLIVR